MKILLIDDDESFQELFRRSLSIGPNIELKTVGLLEEGLLIANDYDVCVVDLLLPDSGGAEETITEVVSKITKPSVIVSGITDYNLSYILGKIRIGFIPKSISPIALVMILSNIIGFYEVSQEAYDILKKI